ncbi:PilZ domain-containing protein [Desulfococcus sp.]|uniref:PilZ domain-containing protein n=1 Tax=Desulfococcus sp. TaxID=2025834 RepID=UPI0035935155
MNEVKAFIDSEGKAIIKCPECHEVRLVDVKNYTKLDRHVRFKVKCSCTHAFKVLLERREYYRRAVDFDGTCLLQGGTVQAEVKICDLSRKGMKVQLLKESPIAVGDKVMVEFRLDDEKKTLIRKDAVVRSIMGQFLGMEFFSIDPHNVYDKALGFYLM